jgi:acyl-CoA synthetase (AMP-forming)/AMP-acid ligase II
MRGVRLRDRRHGEGASALQPAHVARAPVKFQESIAVAPGAVAQVRALGERRCVPGQLANMAMQFVPVRSALTGRPDLIIGGKSPIFAVEVERILTAHPAVRDAAGIGIRGAELGQRVEGFVQLERGLRGGVVDELLASALSC